MYMSNVITSLSHRAPGQKYLQLCESRSEASAKSKSMRFKSSNISSLWAFGQFDQYSQTALAIVVMMLEIATIGSRGGEEDTRRPNSDLDGTDWICYYEQAVSEEHRTASRSVDPVLAGGERRCGEVSFGLQFGEI